MASKVVAAKCHAHACRTLIGHEMELLLIILVGDEQPRGVDRGLGVVQVLRAGDKERGGVGPSVGALE